MNFSSNASSSVSPRRPFQFNVTRINENHRFNKQPLMIQQHPESNHRDHGKDIGSHDKIRMVDRFSFGKERSLHRNGSSFDKRMDDKFSKTAVERQKSSERVIQGMISPVRIGECQHQRWLQHVKRLKHTKKISMGKTVSATKEANNEKPKRLQPFSNFIKTNQRISSNRSLKSTESAQRVRFSTPNEELGSRDTATKDCALMYTSAETVASSGTTSTSERNENRHSFHKCSRTVMNSCGTDQKYIEKCYWTKKDLDRTMARTQHRANTFRADHPSTVKQLCRTFLDICNQGTGTYSKDHMLLGDIEAEEQEEMLRDFLRHWAASNVRGLEELVTGRNMFTETRKMAVQSVLAYQQTLREGGNNKNIDTDRIVELLRARSESTSHRSRMFAMYLALGDALVANGGSNESGECNSSLDDPDISINME